MGMKTLINFAFLVIASASLAGVQSATFAADSSRTTASPWEVAFHHPPPMAKPGLWWHWMGSNISKDGITKDLEAFKAAGFSSTTIIGLADICIPWAGKIGYQGALTPNQWFGGPVLSPSAGSMVLRDANGLVVDSFNYGRVVDPWAAQEDGRINQARTPPPADLSAGT